MNHVHVWSAALVAASLLSLACSESPTAPTELVIVDMVVGTGATAAAGDTVTVHYVGSFTSGQVFESSYAANRPFTFRLGTGAVIQGWDQGVPGMRVGGKRRLTIPPHLGYGSQPVGPIPANSTLVFEIELLSIAGR